MKIEDIQKVSQSTTNIKELTSELRSYTLGRLAEDLGVNKGQAEYILYKALIYNVPYADLLESIQYYSDENLL